MKLNVKSFVRKSEIFVKHSFLEAKKIQNGTCNVAFCMQCATLHQIIDRVLYCSINTIAIVKTIVTKIIQYLYFIFLEIMHHLKRTTIFYSVTANLIFK